MIWAFASAAVLLTLVISTQSVILFLVQFLDFPSYLLVFRIKIVLFFSSLTVLSKGNAEQCKIVVIFQFAKWKVYKFNHNLFMQIGVTMHLLICLPNGVFKVERNTCLTSFYVDVRVEHVDAGSQTAKVMVCWTFLSWVMQVGSYSSHFETYKIYFKYIHPYYTFSQLDMMLFWILLQPASL